MDLPPSEWIEQIIRINSVTNRSNGQLVGFLTPLLKKCGMKIHENKFVEHHEVFTNLIAYSHHFDQPDLLAFSSHLDTVSTGEPEQWTKTAGDPFQATRIRNRIYGLGTADVKLDFLCKIWAAQKSKPWNRPFAIVGTYGEERGLVGAEKLFQTKGFEPKYALVGQPSNLELIYAHKGHLLFTAELALDLNEQQKRLTTSKKTWKGKTSHSANPTLGINALERALNELFKRGLGIVSLQTSGNPTSVPDSCSAQFIPEQTATTKKLFRFLYQLEELAREMKNRRNTRFTPPRSTLVLTQAQTYGDRLRLTFDMRTLPEVNVQSLGNKLEKIAAASGCPLVDIIINSPLHGQKEGSLMKSASSALKRCGVKVVKKAEVSSTEAAIYQDNGAEAVAFGPGLARGNAHCPNEYNITSQLAAATQFYRTMMSTPATA